MNIPLVAAPMAGGPTTPELVAAAVKAGGTGFLAAGYRTPEQMSEDISALKSLLIDDTEQPFFGVNLFNSPAESQFPEQDQRIWTAYQEALAPLAKKLGAELASEARTDDDFVQEKVQVLIDNPVPMVSFTFDLPDSATVAALRAVGTLVGATVTEVPAAAEAVARGVDFLVVQGPHAGGHQSLPLVAGEVSEEPLLATVQTIRANTDIPVIAAGGVGSSADVQELLAAGATAVAVGTMLLRADEAGTNDTYRQVLAEVAAGDRSDVTVFTRAFSGRWARALHNKFIDKYGGTAPALYPQVHYLTSPIRNAAKEAGDSESLNLWAGTGVKNTRAGSVTEIFADLSS